MNVQVISLTDLIDPPFVLREVNHRSVEFTELRESLKRVGFLNSICVRSSERDSGKFEVVDGRWRTAAAGDGGLTEAPCIVKTNLTDQDILALQVTANAVRFKTQPSVFARQIHRLLMSKEGMTQAELCQIVQKNPAWVRKMLGVAKLSHLRRYRGVIDRGEMPLESAYYLSRLNKSDWDAYAMEAKVLPVKEFRALIMACLRDRRTQRQIGRERREDKFEAQPFGRSVTELLSEVKESRVGPMMLTVLNCKTVLESWQLALKWAIHLDPKSVERQLARTRRRLKKHVVKR